MPRAPFAADPAALYFTDNGAVLCGDHLGMTAKYSGRDISGQKIEKVTPEDAAEAKTHGWAIECERCGKRAPALHSAPSLIVVA